MGQRKSGKNAYIKVTAPDGSSIELSGLATDGRSRSNQYAMEFDFDTKRAAGFNEDWKESVPVGSSLWQAGVFAFYNAAADEVEEFLQEMHAAQHAPADCADAGEYTLEIIPGGECYGEPRYNLSNAVLLRLDMPELPGQIMRIGALFGGWTSERESVNGVFAATSLGLYWASPFYFDEREVKWSRLGQALEIKRFAVNPENPTALQLAIGSNKVWIRQPAENSDWQEILDYSTALATIGEDNLGQNHFAWVVYNPVLEMIHVSYNYKNTGYKYILSSPDCGTSWVASEYLPPPSFRYVIGNMVIHPSTGELYVSGCAYYTGSGLVMHSIDAVSFDVDVSFDGGGWAPYLFRDSEGAVYAGEATDSYPRLYRREDGGWTQVDGSLGAGVISGSPNLFDPNGAGAVNPEDVNVVRIIRDNKLYYTNDYWNTGDFRTISEFSLGRAIDCDKKTRLVIGRVDASENDSHVVFSTVNDGVEMRAKGGPHADQLDGGEDSIPYPAKIADNGIKIV